MDLSRLNVIGEWAGPRGLALRGAFHPDPEDGVPRLADGRKAGTLILLGFTGDRQWPVFEASPEARDGRPEPLDRWSRRLVGELAALTGGMALYPFADELPRLPFLRWAEKAESLHRSPIGLFIHPDWGLWHAYRGALAVADSLPLPPCAPRPSPCETCADKPCLSACPVEALVPGGYDVTACRNHIATTAGKTCLRCGCRARRVCPAGASHQYGDRQAEFHMTAFIHGRHT